MSEHSLRQRYVDMRNGGFYTWDVLEDTFWGDENFARITGFSQSELDGGLPADRMLTLIHYDDAPLVMGAIKTAVLYGRPFEVIYRFKKGNSYLTLTDIGRGFRYSDGVATLFSGIVFETAQRTSISKPSNLNTP